MYRGTDLSLSCCIIRGLLIPEWRGDYRQHACDRAFERLLASIFIISNIGNLVARVCD